MKSLKLLKIKPAIQKLAAMIPANKCLFVVKR